MASAAIVHDRFTHHFSGAAVSKWKKAIGPSGSVYSASNRLFTMKTDAPTEQGTTFEPGVDPTGALEMLKSVDMFHGPENIVKYFRRTTDDSTGKYLQSYPGSFRVGDLVEMQASFVAIMTSQDQVKVTSRLHALTLLDTSFTKVSPVRTKQRSKLNVKQAAQKKRASFQANTSLLQKQVRRKIGYDYEEEEQPESRKRTNLGSPRGGYGLGDLDMV
ncbi:hypothetical protein C8R47DRAFT_984488 [Mycena vitilis]|nr:hypothetical protein C8R47DRAFT_984488 [Mycena vitilis]